MISRSLAARLTLVVFFIAVAGCGSGGGGSQPPVGSGAQLTLSTPAATLDEGGGPVDILVAGTTATSGAVTWSLSPAVGTLSATSNSQATFTPPPVDVITAETVVLVTATPTSGRAGSLPLTVRLVPFSVQAATPAVVSEVPVNAAPSITFNRAVAGASVSAASVVLRSAAGSVNATRSISARTVTTTPDSALTWGTRYTLEANAAVRSQLGQPLAPPFKLDFDTVQPTWGAPRYVDPGTFAAGMPAIGYDRDGNALLVWMRDTDGTGLWNLWYARFAATTGTWSAAAPIMASTAAMTEPQVAVEDDGDSLLVWQQTESGVTSIFSARFAASTGSWGDLVPLHSTAQGVGGLKLAMNAAGVATAVWQRQDIPARIFVSRYAPATNSWSNPVSPQTSAASAVNPHVAVDRAGNAVTVWRETSSILASRFDVAAGSWSAPVPLHSGPAPVGEARVVVDAAGDATAAWTQGQAPLLTAARYDAASATWGGSRSVQPGNGLPELAVDPAGNVIAIQTYGHGGNVFSVEAARYEAATRTWTSTSPLETISPASFSNPYKGVAFITFDTGGNAIAAWPRDVGGGIYNVYVARYNPAGGPGGTWTAPLHIQSTSATTNEVSASADRFGNAIVVWVEDVGGVFNLVAARLSGN